MGRSGQWPEWVAAVVSFSRSTVFEGFWYPSWVATVLASSDWYCGFFWLAERELEGQGRGLLDTGRKQPPEPERIRGCSLWIVLSYLPRRNSLNGSQCQIDLRLSLVRGSKLRAYPVVEGAKDGRWLDGGDTKR